MLSKFPDSDNESEATTEVVDELYRLQNEASTSTATELCNTNSETEVSIEPTVTIDVINQLYHTQNDVSSSDTESCDTHFQSDHYSDPDYVLESNNITNTSLALSSQEASLVDTNQGANFDPEPFSEETDQEASTKKIRPRKRKGNQRHGFKMIQDTCTEKTKGQEQRSNVFSYFISVGGQEHELCMSAFMSVHSIGKKRLTRLKQSKNHPTPPRDLRGLHGKQPCTPEDLNIKIRQHIRSFPTITSHYSRQMNPNKRYLHPNLNIKRMWLLYLGQNEPEEKNKYCTGKNADMRPKVHYSLYKGLFFSEVNLGFGRPKSKTCLNCDRIHSNAVE
ncbi:hypothetical protein PoB_006551300 [Plakobranchus ocellatus]|uniref:Uncharacterized protein n=1 Tax=Plakobranchus ocellatus TaxID=259542 RepID=A0AAV4D4R5_9GAST|nr:hypothetical protein PoB_006551300 [Plakobranchus ocellatus]